MPPLLLSLLGLALKQWKYRLTLSVAGVAYWIVYAFSDGMLSYYSFDLTPLLKASQVSNPFILESRSLTDLYSSGMIWYPTNHLQVNLLYGPTFFSIALSSLFSLNVVLTVYRIRSRWPVAGLGLNGVAGIVPALFSGGCCTVPFGTVLFASFVPAAALSSFAYDYVILTNSLFGLLMLFTLLYGAKRLGRCSMSCSTDTESTGGKADVVPASRQSRSVAVTLGGPGWTTSNQRSRNSDTSSLTKELVDHYLEIGVPGRNQTTGAEGHGPVQA